MGDKIWGLLLGLMIGWLFGVVFTLNKIVEKACYREYADPVERGVCYKHTYFKNVLLGLEYKVHKEDKND